MEVLFHNNTIQQYHCTPTVNALCSCPRNARVVAATPGATMITDRIAIKNDQIAITIDQIAIIPVQP
jgi:hypothetical protein